MTPLERGQLGVMRAHAGIRALLLLAAAAAAEVALSRATDMPIGIVGAPVALLTLYTVLIAPGRRFRAWGYRLGLEELVVAHGVWTKVETHVPLARVQHVDVSQGPIERAAHVTRLILHTAGTANSVVVLPGLARGTAEAIRDEVRARNRDDDR